MARKNKRTTEAPVTTTEAPVTTTEAPVTTTEAAPSPFRKPLASPVNGAPFTLARICRAVAANVTDGVAVLSRRGKRGGWELLRACRIASLSKLQPGSAPSGWVVATLLRAADANAERALARAAAWAEATRADGEAGKLASDRPAAWIAADIARLLASGGDGANHNRGTVKRGVGAAYSDRTRTVAAVAYVCSAPLLLPEWVLTEPIPDHLREPGAAALLLELERAL